MKRTMSFTDLATLSSSTHIEVRKAKSMSFIERRVVEHKVLDDLLEMFEKEDNSDDGFMANLSITVGGLLLNSSCDPTHTKRPHISREHILKLISPHSPQEKFSPLVITTLLPNLMKEPPINSINL
jgi:hypothetical protein